jgi:hypothetical protein
VSSRLLRDQSEFIWFVLTSYFERVAIGSQVFLGCPSVTKVDEICLAGKDDLPGTNNRA